MNHKKTPALTNGSSISVLTYGSGLCLGRFGLVD